jgi:hypothetical protein
MAMLTIDSFPAVALGKPVATRKGLQRLFAAAVVNDQFRETLLRKPEEALANGYLGQTFLLSDREKMLIQSIRADSLTDLAQQVNRALKNI